MADLNPVFVFSDLWYFPPWKSQPWQPVSMYMSEWIASEQRSYLKWYFSRHWTEGEGDNLTSIPTDAQSAREWTKFHTLDCQPRIIFKGVKGAHFVVRWPLKVREVFHEFRLRLQAHEQVCCLHLGNKSHSTSCDIPEFNFTTFMPTLSMNAGLNHGMHATKMTLREMQWPTYIPTPPTQEVVGCYISAGSIQQFYAQHVHIMYIDHDKLTLSLKYQKLWVLRIEQILPWQAIALDCCAHVQEDLWR